jgi:hypothetical protein
MIYNKTWKELYAKLHRKGGSVDPKISDLFVEALKQDNCDHLWDKKVGDTLHLMADYCDLRFSAKAGFKMDGTRLAVVLQVALVKLLKDPRLKWLSLECRDIPSLDNISMIYGWRTTIEKDLSAVTEIKLPKWSGYMRTWLPFAIKVRSKMSSLGLDDLITPLPEDEGSEEYKRLTYKRMAVIKYDTMFFHALEESIAHKDSKMPRQDLVNMAMWGKPPHRGSVLWEYCLALMDNEYVVEDRKRYYEQQLTGCLLDSKEDVHADSVAFNTAAIRLSYRPIVNNEDDESKANAEFISRVKTQFRPPVITGMSNTVKTTQELYAMRSESIQMMASKDRHFMYQPGGKGTGNEKGNSQKGTQRRVEGWVLGKHDEAAPEEKEDPPKQPAAGKEDEKPTSILKTPKSRKKEKQQKTAPAEKTPKAGDSTKEDSPAEKDPKKKDKTWIPPAVFKLLTEEQKRLIKEGKKELVAQSLSSLADGINTWASQAKGKIVRIQGDPAGDTNKSNGNPGGDGESTKDNKTGSKKRKRGNKNKGGGAKARRIQADDTAANHIVPGPIPGLE